MRVIDSHTHCFPDEVAGKAVARLTSAYQCIPSFDGTIAGLIGQMDAAGIEASAILPVATKAVQVKSINDWIAGIESNRVIKMGAMHPEFPDPAEEIARMASMEIRGFKLHPNWQAFRPDDPRMSPVYEAAQEHGLIAYFHAGDELEEWPEELLATPEALRQVRDGFPRLKMVAAHMGGYRMWDDVEKYLLGEDIYFDASACFPEDLPDDRYLGMMRDHGMEKILYGSDSPCSDPASQLERLLSFPLTDGEKDVVCYGNAVRLFSLE